MRIALALVIGIHGIAHLPGFLNGYGLSEFNGLTLPISKPAGMLWLESLKMKSAMAYKYP